MLPMVARGEGPPQALRRNGLDLEERGEVAVMRLRRGKVNALDVELLLAITEAMRAVGQARAVVITGAGPVFSAGLDLQRIIAGGPSYIRELLPALSESCMAIFDHPGPVVAAVNGHAIAGGCVIAAACDVRLMSQGTIGLAELSVGVPFPPVPMEIMRHATGPAQLASSRRFAARRARLAVAAGFRHCRRQQAAARCRTGSPGDAQPGEAAASMHRAVESRKL